jgi:5-(carboxyamino)imidazole ribonucleotide synthase
LSAPSTPLSPGATIGILGGGQLGRMLALAAARLGLKYHVFCPDPQAPAFDVVRRTTQADYGDESALDRFAEAVDVVTYEFENVPADTAKFLSERRPVLPDPGVLATTQDRLAEKSFLAGLGIPTAPFAGVDGPVALAAALERIGPPAVLKTRRFGYDGKGQALIRPDTDLARAWEEIGAHPSIVESFVPFEREISVIVVRGRNGAEQFYDVVENVHENGILAISRAPARIAQALAVEAKTIAGKIAEALGHVGVLCVEMFARSGDKPELVVNEFAPRVHNSGHWTLDACLVSQFENHIRAICGWPLGETARHSDAVMTNLIGSDVDKWRALATEPDTALHLYGKAEARLGRKMGHVTRLYAKS